MRVDQMLPVLSVILVATCSLANTRNGLACSSCHVATTLDPRDAGTAPAWRGSFQIPDRGSSLTCLGCHDGTVSSLTLNTMSTGEAERSPIAMRIGHEFGGDHPVDILYTPETALRLGDLIIPASSSEVREGIPLFRSRLQCGSCHTLHHHDVASSLRLPPGRLCLACHEK